MNIDKKKWENFFYYHGWHVLITIVVLLITFHFLFQKLNTVKYDYTIAYIAQKQLSYEEEENLVTSFEKVADDFNKDGNVRIKVLSYVFDNNKDTQATASSNIRFMGDLELGTFSIVIYENLFREFLQEGEILATSSDLDSQLGQITVSKELQPLNIALVDLKRIDQNKQKKQESYFISSEKLLTKYQKTELATKENSNDRID